MPRHVILMSGTPGVGKTTLAHALTAKLDAVYVNLTDLALDENLILGKDKQRDSMIVDETRMKRRMGEMIEKCQDKDIVIDGHYAVDVVPKKSITQVFVLRRDPVELRRLMESSGISGRKLWENLASEVLDVCLVDALRVLGTSKVCEVDMSGKSVEQAVSEILEILGDNRKCRVGIVDWIGKLESEGLLDECLRI
jgi:adenylate kinase